MICKTKGRQREGLDLEDQGCLLEQMQATVGGV